ncbi:hypothetical protein HID58_051351 [Brassica napus]|uniref:Uncharacterized protein n=1 Tax=Brassica napus TaxID=3708 RepID=A0ABQ8A9D3_BRANA|nr:hypothetical protein HID58_051351 [Brassica napus]
MTSVFDEPKPSDDNPHESKIVINGEEEEEENDSPVEEVRLTVPTTDDPSLPVLTFRTWFLGLVSCILLAFVNQFFSFRSNQLWVSSVAAQVLTLPLGKFMAATLPTKKFVFPGTKWSWSFNPGPFNVKEHVLISIFANTGAGGAYATSIITIVKAFYHLVGIWMGWDLQEVPRGILFKSHSLGLFLSTGGLTKRATNKTKILPHCLRCELCLLHSPWLPLPFHLRNLIRLLIWKSSVTAQIVGSGLKDLGIGSFGLDWSTVAGFLGSPLAVPFFAIANFFAGFFIFLYILLPIFYWSNAYDAQKFPFYTSQTFEQTGHSYNITRILNEKDFDINLDAYNDYSKLYLSVMFALLYGLSFASLFATISHVALYDGKFIWGIWKKTTTATKDKFGDVHSTLMKKNYQAVPQWWFIAVLVASFAFALYTCEGFDKQLQLPWWGLILACAIAMFFTLPIGVIQATTNHQVGLNVITELIIGYLYPGKPLANVAFKTYGYISMSQALCFVGDFKLGHYMKIPPRSMFIVQLVATVVSSTVCFGTTWWLITSVENVCNTDFLPVGSPWTCPGYEVFYNASIKWGVIGPRRMFTKEGIYPGMNWFFLVGIFAPVPFWYSSKKFPEKKWLKHIHIPLIFSAVSSMPQAKAVHYWSWTIVGVVFNYYIFRRFKSWWARHNYILSAALDAGTAIMGVLIFFVFQNNDVSLPDWWGLENSDHCNLAHCPTAKGVVVKGCPVF